MESNSDGGRRIYLFMELTVITLCLFTWVTDAVLNPPPTRIAYACENSQMDLQCDGGVIRIITANYGRYTNQICNPVGATNYDLMCGMKDVSTRVLGERCDGRRSCAIIASNKVFGQDPCTNTKKYLEVRYFCEAVTATPSPSTTTTTSTTSSTTTSTTTSTTSAATRPSTTRSRPSIPTRRPVHNATSSSHVVSSSIRRPTTHRPTLAPDHTETHVRQFCRGADRHGVWWGPVEAGLVVSRQCPDGYSGIMTWRCGRNGWIRDPDLSNCVSEWVDNIEDMLQNESEDVVRVAEMIEDQTAKKKMSAGDLKKTTKDLFPKLTESLKKQMQIGTLTEKRVRLEKFSASVVKTGSNLLSKQQADSWKELPEADRSKVATSLVTNMEEAGFQIAVNLQSGQAMTANDDNMLMEVTVVNPAFDSGDEMVFPSRNVLPSDSHWKTSVNQFSLPKENLHSVVENGVLRIVFLMYNNLGEWMNPVDEESNQNQDDVVTQYSTGQQEEEVAVTMAPKKNSSQYINTKIFSASINNRKKKLMLEKPMTYILAHNEELKNLDLAPHCSYWNISQSTEGGQWSTSGCRVMYFNITHTTCQCDHLTNFAVLMDITGTKLSQEHRISLTAITYVGCIISILCLLCSFFTFSFFKNLQCDRNTIHKNLVLCLMLAELVFLIGITLTQHRVLCGIIAGVLHFLFLAAFGWMLLEGVQLYVMLIEVFEAERSRRKWYYLGGYGVPLIIVAISAGIRSDGYGTETHCWLSTDYGLIWSFVGPVIAVITINIVMLSIAVYMMCKHANTLASALRTKEKSRLDKINQDPTSSSSNGSSSTSSPKRTKSEILGWIKGAVVLVVLLGLTWAFGILYLNEESVVMAYIFTILNTLQGLFIFLFHCLMNEKVKKEYKKLAYRTTWMPSCLRNICVGYSGSMSHSPNNSDSSGGYLLKFWSRNKRKSSTSTYDRSFSHPKGKRRSDLESYSSNDTNSALFSRTASNRYSNNSKINGHSNGHVKMRPNDGIMGDLSVADCSIIDSEYVSEYCHNNLQVSLEKRRYSSGSEDDNIEEPNEKRLSVLSEDSATKHASDFVPSEVDADDYGGYLEPQSTKIHEQVVRQLSEYENAPLMPKTESEKNLLNDLLSHYHGENKKQYPSMSEIYNTDASSENVNQSTPNLKYKIDLKSQLDSVTSPMLHSLPDVTRPTAIDTNHISHSQELYTKQNTLDKTQQIPFTDEGHDNYGHIHSNGYKLKGYIYSDR